MAPQRFRVPGDLGTRLRRTAIAGAALALSVLSEGAAADTFQVTKTADTDDGVCDVDCSLREAVAAASALPAGDVVLLPAGVFSLTSSAFALVSDTIRGTGAHDTVIVIETSDPIVVNMVDGDTALERLSIRYEGDGLKIPHYSPPAPFTLRLDSVSIETKGSSEYFHQTLQLTGHYASVVIRNSFIAGLIGPWIFLDGHAGWHGSFTLENSTVFGLLMLDPPDEGAQRRIANSTVGSIDTADAIELDHAIILGGCSPATTPVSRGHNIANDTRWGCNLDQPSDRPATDPLLGPLEAAPNGTWTLPPLPGSPAIDGGNPAGCRRADGTVFGLDQRGVSRPLDGDGDGVAVCDVGAHEVTPCENGRDDDGDGAADYPSDPGCGEALGVRENPQCEDGIDNDGQPGIDFDGGASVNGGVPIAAPDPQCTAAWKNEEAAAATCGLGAELALVLPLIGVGHRRSRRVT